MSWRSIFIIIFFNVPHPSSLVLSLCFCLGLSAVPNVSHVLCTMNQELKHMLKVIRTGKGTIKLKSSDKSAEEKAIRAADRAKAAKATAKTDTQKVRQRLACVVHGTYV